MPLFVLNNNIAHEWLEIHNQHSKENISFDFMASQKLMVDLLKTVQSLHQTLEDFVVHSEPTIAYCTLIGCITFAIIL